MLEALRETPERVLAIYAHPDDADVSCGGTLAHWAANNCEVHLAVCTLGDKGSRDKNVDVAQLIKRRASEVESSRKVLGITTVYQLECADGELENDLVLRARLVKLIRLVRPSALICPDPLAVFFGEHYYNHHDHRAVGFAALDSASPAAASPLYFPDAGESFAVRVAYLSGSLKPNVFVDIAKTIERKADAVLCHRSQLDESDESIRALFRERAIEAGRIANVEFAEVFRRIYLAH